MTVSLAVLLLVAVTSAARLPLQEEQLARQQARSPHPDRTTTTTTPFTTTPGFQTTTPFPTTTGSWPEWATCKVENYHYYPTHYLALGECGHYIGGCYEACCQADGQLSYPTFVCDFGGPSFRKRQAQPPVIDPTVPTTTSGTTVGTTVGTTTSGSWTTPFPATTPTTPGTGCYVENLHYYPAHWLAVGECNAYIGGCYQKCCQPDGNLSPSTYICGFGDPWWGEGPNPALQP
ncbi:uncharacterized protein [Branchiostoma lanceolatum]|uniref:uncharacterized protein n=1 Tax=Branchiostoma lanceolatum TaxID=7740 RepID=UPI003454A414